MVTAAVIEPRKNKCAYCTAEIAGELIRNVSKKLSVEGACPRLWCRVGFLENTKKRKKRFFRFFVFSRKPTLHQRRGQAPSTDSFFDTFLINSPAISAVQYAHLFLRGSITAAVTTIRSQKSSTSQLVKIYSVFMFKKRESSCNHCSTASVLAVPPPHLRP